MVGAFSFGEVVGRARGYLDLADQLKANAGTICWVSCSGAVGWVSRPEGGATGGRGQPMTTHPGPDETNEPDDAAEVDEVVPLAVWPCEQATAQRQRAGVYLPESRCVEAS
jgi:hypothetical protein